MEYSPPAMLIEAAVLMPETVIGLEITTVPTVALLTAAKVKTSGVVSGATAVVTLNVPVAPPMLNVACVAVLALAELVTLTVTI